MHLASLLNGPPDPKQPQRNDFPVRVTLTIQMAQQPSVPAGPAQPMTLITAVSPLRASNAPIAASQFAIPAGYRNVTPASRPGGPAS